jgi:hypothetical protein
MENESTFESDAAASAPAPAVPGAAVKTSAGRIVHYILPAGGRQGSHRAAIIVSDFGGTSVNLNVQLDQLDDWTESCAAAGLQKTGEFTARAWSAPYDATGMRPGSWHWPERT